MPISDRIKNLLSFNYNLINLVNLLASLFHLASLQTVGPFLFINLNLQPTNIFAKHCALLPQCRIHES
jgi:hypothetical protein